MAPADEAITDSKIAGDLIIEDSVIEENGVVSFVIIVPIKVARME
jgi:hypothetical protein